MKRKQIFLFWGTIAALLSACTTKNTNDISFSELQIPNTNDTTNNPLTADNVSTYSSIYAQIAADNTSDSVKYALIYLDNDTIPELVVYDAGYDTYSLYTLKDESAFCMLDSFTTVELSYFEQTGIICSFTRWNGGGDEGGYGFSYYQTGSDKTLTDLSEPILSDTYNAVYNDNGEFTGEGITNYYHLGAEIDEASYQTRLSELGIKQGNGKSCMENALTKDEFLRDLN
jgi:hypothetical protein